MNYNRLKLPKEIKLNNGNIIENNNIEYYIKPLKKRFNKKTKDKFIYYILIIMLIYIYIVTFSVSQNEHFL